MASRKEEKEAARQARIEKEAELAANQARGRRMAMLGTVVGIAIVAVVVAIVVSTSSSKQKSGGNASTVAARFAGIPQSGNTLGDPNAPVTMTEFIDLKCPFCRAYAVGAYPDLIAKYVKTGKLKINVQLQTFLDQSTPGTADSTAAAKFAEAVAKQNKFFNFADLFYIDQKDESEVYATDSYLTSLAKQIPGINVSKALTERKDPKISNELSSMSDAYTASNAQGTPSFEIGKTGGKQSPLTINNTDSIDEFATAIDGLIGS